MKACSGLDQRAASWLFGGRAVLITTSALIAPQQTTPRESHDVLVLTRFASVETPPPRA